LLEEYVCKKILAMMLEMVMIIRQGWDAIPGFRRLKTVQETHAAVCLDYVGYQGITSSHPPEEEP
jgi:hypothetical protein